VIAAREVAMNSVRRPSSQTLDWSGNPLLAYYGSLADDDERRRRALTTAVAAAATLHLLIVLLVPRPPEEEAPPAAPPPLVLRLAPTPRFLPPPPPPPQTVEAPAHRVPVPDPTPDEPEPVREFEPLPMNLDLPIDTLAVSIAEPPPQPPKVLPVGGDVLAPVRLSAPEPPYPRAALIARKEGTVILEAIIDPQGRVTSLRALTALGFGLEEAALETVRTWTFEPGTLHGEPVPVLYHLSVRFNLAR